MGWSPVVVGAGRPSGVALLQRHDNSSNHINVPYGRLIEECTAVYSLLLCVETFAGRKLDLWA